MRIFVDKIFQNWYDIQKKECVVWGKKLNYQK